MNKCVFCKKPLEHFGEFRYCPDCLPKQASPKLYYCINFYPYLLYLSVRLQDEHYKERMSNFIVNFFHQFANDISIYITYDMFFEDINDEDQNYLTKQEEEDINNFFNNLPPEFKEGGYIDIGW